MIYETGLLFEALTRGDSAEEIVRMAQEKLLKNPILVTNSFFSVITMSCNTEFKDPVWENARLHRRMSKEHTEVFAADPASALLFEQGSSFLYNTGLGEDIPRILGKINIKGKTMGYVVVFEVDHSLGKRDIQLSDLLCQALSVVLANTNTIEFISESNVEYFLRGLLADEDSSALDNESEIVHFDWTMKPYYRAISAKFIRESEKNKEYIPYILNTLNELDPRYLIAFEQKHAFFVLANYQKESELAFFEEQLRAIGEQYDLCFGESRSFSSIRNMPLYYKQARLARQIGSLLEPAAVFHTYAQYSFYALLVHLDAKELKCMQCKEYKALRQYDQIHHTPFLETVVAYYLSGSNMVKASESLHIHRNTLSYRLNKATQIMQKEVSDVLLLDAIHHAWMIENWIEKCIGDINHD